MEQAPQEEPIMSPVERPIEKKKREITEKQKQALAKARLARAVKKEQKKTPTPQKSQSTEEIFNFSGNYLIATAVLGLGGLAGYYFLKQQKSSEEWQQSLEEKLGDLRNSMPVLPKTLIQKEVMMSPEKPPQIIEREIIREVEKKQEPVPVLSAEEQKKLDYFSNAKTI